MRILRLPLCWIILGICGNVFGQMDPAETAGNFWQVSPNQTFSASQGLQLPAAYERLDLDLTRLRQYLQDAPQEAFQPYPFIQPSLPLTVPMPTGEMLVFNLYQSPIMETTLQLKYPDIQTFAGDCPTVPGASIRIDIGSNGFHAIILSPKGTVYIDPMTVAPQYLSYFKRDVRRSQAFAERLIGRQHRSRSPVDVGSRIANGAELRTYRLALAATGEYTQFFGGTVIGALSGMVTTINRVNAIYERELAIRLVLVGDNDKLIFTDGMTDPYSNTNPIALSNQNQTTIDQVIGNTRYDIGHVFSTGGGGLANLASVCDPTDKAKGVTGIATPTGDPFDVDYVSHEIGHQFGAQHTYNGQRLVCGGQREMDSAYEPGSGSTIMAYAGLCGDDDLQFNSDAYFHSHSYQQILVNITSGMASTCGAITPTGNTPPVVGIPPMDHTIPILTPFELEGFGQDIDGDALSYCWEQYDLGPAGGPQAPSLNAPMFRSYPPSPSPIRTFPRLQDILDSTSTKGEVYPTYTRSLTFRLTVRDQRIAGGGVNFSAASIDVTALSGPFTISQPNDGEVTWWHGDSAEVVWDIANTDMPPVNCQAVNVLLSLDGGYTFPDSLVLAKNVPNKGQVKVNIPSVSTRTARVKIKAADNVFFDISNKDFSILGNVGAEKPLPDLGVHIYPNPFQDKLWLEMVQPVDFTFELIDMKGRVLFQKTFKNTGDRRMEIPIPDLPSGVFCYKILMEKERVLGKICH